MSIFGKTGTMRENLLRASVGFFFTFVASVSAADIIWSGDFETGDFLQWHRSDDADAVVFHQIPEYGRPIQYGGQNANHIGNGDLLSLVSVSERTIDGVRYPQGPTRQGSYAAMFRVKTSSNGSEPADCDNGRCERRRSQLTVQQTLPEYYNALPYLSERWLSFSVFLPSDWETKSGGWGPVIIGVKPLKENGLSGNFAVSLKGSSWGVAHRWSDAVNPDDADVPWQYQMYYTNDDSGNGPYPRAESWPDGLQDFPDIAESRAALGRVTKGGWTDWIVHTRFDARGSNQGGTGFLTVWKRDSGGPWVEVLHIVPKQTTRGNLTFNHGIGYNSPAGSNHPGGFGVKVGLYMDDSQVWNNSRDRVLYIDNVKVGDANSTFEDMAPDGTAVADTPPPPPGDTRPNPPALLSGQ